MAQGVDIHSNTMGSEWIFSEGDRVDRYVVERLLGEGGSAQVWQVRHQLLGTPYALKVLRSPDRTIQQQLLREGRAQAVLSHPAILPVRDAFWVRGHMALLMPLVEGPSLRQVLAEGRVPAEEALAVIVALLGGLTVVHGKGLVHCDLKPENVLFDLQESGVQPRMVDFGLVSRFGCGVARGTPAYVAPELLGGSVAGPRSDLFSIGALFYELLTGHRAFPIETLAAARTRGLPDLRGVPAALRGLLASLMAPNPEGRPASSQAVLEALASVGPLPPHGEIARRAVALRLPVAAALPPEVDRLVDVTHAVPHNLPPDDTGFVGRRAELATLAARLEQGGRLLDIVGMGGVGKTRLAIRFAHQHRRVFGGGVWLCPLRGIGDVSGICAAIRTALGLGGEALSVPELCDILTARGATMLVLDGAEDALLACRDMLPELLVRAPQLTIVVTSRQSLGLPHESRFLLTPLLPEDAVQLFLERAAASGARLDSGARPDVLALVGLLDRLPLPIELAAARAALLTVAEMHDRLQDDLTLLCNTGPRSLCVVLEQTWAALPGPAQEVLAQLSVLDGSFSIGLVEPLVTLSGEAALLDVLQQLLAAGMLQPSDGHSSQRLQMLHTIRHFAAGRLSKPDRGAVMRRMVTLCMRFSRPDAVRERRLMLLAARWGVHNLSGDEAGGLIHRTHHTLMVCGERAEAAALLALVSGSSSAMSPAIQARLRLCLAWSDQEAGRISSAFAAIEEARALLADAADPQTQRMISHAQAALLRALGRYTSANQILRRLVDRNTHDDFQALVSLADGLRAVGEFGEATALLTLAIRSEQRVSSLLNLVWARMELDTGQFAAASERIEVFFQSPDLHTTELITAYLFLAEAALLHGRLDDAARFLSRAQETPGRASSLLQRGHLDLMSGAVAAARGEPARAVEQLQQALLHLSRSRHELLLALARAELALCCSELRRHDDANEHASKALALARRQQTIYRPLIAGLVAVVFARSGAVRLAEDALAAAGPPQTALARIALSAGRAAVLEHTAPASALPRWQAARETLHQVGVSSRCLVGRLLQPPVIRSVPPSYSHTLPRTGDEESGVDEQPPAPHPART